MNNNLQEQRQIAICRVVCIFLMMSVHVPPGMGQPSVMTSGDFAWLGAVWADFLGRASVAALSFISGYLLVRTAATAPLATLAARRFESLIVPMLVWNLAYIGLGVAKGLALGVPWEMDGGPVAEMTGLTGPTANLSLFFLRDLFVSALLVRLALPVLARWPVAVLAGVLAVTAFDLAEPVVFRPSILFFVVAGAVFALRGLRLAEGWGVRRTLVALLVLGVAYGAVRLSALHEVPAARELEDVLRRGTLVVASLAGGAALAETQIGVRIARLEADIYLTYLMHVIVISLLWVLWQPLMGEANAPVYVVFFLAAPVVALVAGQAAGRVCDRMPPWMQRLVRGKSARRRDGVLSGRAAGAKARDTD